MPSEAELARRARLSAAGTAARSRRARERIEKECPGCWVTLPLAAYGGRASSPDGHDFYCRPCRNAASRAYKRRRREKRRRAWRDAQIAATIAARSPVPMDLLTCCGQDPASGHDPACFIRSR